MALQRFYNAADKLVNAFIMENLHHNDACSCAVGTLCNGSGEWATTMNIRDPYYDEAFSFGYNRFEVFQIEKEFEGRPRPLIEDLNCSNKLTKQTDPDGFKGLCNVFDYMVSIEDWSEEEKGANIFELLESLN